MTMILPLPLSADTLPTGGHYNCVTADDDSVISLRAVPNTLRRVLFDPNPRDRIKRCCSAFFRRRRRSNRSGVNPSLRGGRCQRVRWLAGRPTYARLYRRAARELIRRDRRSFPDVTGMRRRRCGGGHLQWLIFHKRG